MIRPIKKKVISIYFLLSLLLIFFLIQGYSVINKKNKNGNNQKHFTILGLGDSITEGIDKNRSYLYPLWRKLFKAGYSVEFIGPNTHKCPIGSIMNAGFSGKNAEYLDSIIDSVYWKYPADIVLLHTGHNHFADENPIEGILIAQKSIINKIIAINPDVKIFVAQVITSGKLPKYSYIPELNKQISLYIKQLKDDGFPVTLVNQAANFNWEIHCNADKVHPNYEGAEQMANTWFLAIDSELKKENTPKPFNPEIANYKNIDSTALNLHIFKPENKNLKDKTPAIIFFFAGGWSFGSPFQFYKECKYYASKGLVAISAEYRINSVHNSTVFESVSDAKSAIRWVRENAEKYNIDTNKIIAAGASAGGHIAAAAGTINKFDEISENKSISSKPNLLLLYYPVVDNGPDGYGPEYIKQRYTEISPLHNINSSTPPTLMIVGTKDPYLSLEQARQFKQKMEANGNSCELKLYENAGHPIFYYRKGPSEYYNRIIKDSDSFLKKHNYL